MLRVVVVDLGMGNLRSVERALCQAGADRGVEVSIVRSGEPEDVLGADKVVVPGQGAFRDCALSLAKGVGDALRECMARGKPYLGICLGLQVLFDSSDEAPGAKGLGVFRGHVARLDPGTGESAVKIPHMGWNQLEMAQPPPGIFRIWQDEPPHVYFVHSYHAVPDDPSLVVATARHGINRVTAAIARDNVIAVQFHPEKSQSVGLEFLGAFLESA
ncbi:MAG: imidazole glycerol phosphate synthase subunit HisH [Polyangiaceae bacterium]|nr:imidazole glycerol phosphate synthase subunit HisH [Polyangiaceae bacterium]